MKTLIPRFAYLTASAIVAGTLAGCGGGDGGDQQEYGTVRLLTASTQTCAGFDSINVTVNKIRVHPSESAGEGDSGWTDIAVSPARKVNLLAFTNGALDATVQASVPTGDYKQIRLVLDANTNAGTANSVKPTGGLETTLETPAALQSGIVVKQQFHVDAAGRSDVIVAFDACKSVVIKGTGQYLLAPVVTVLPNEINAISGFLSTGLSSSNVIVSAQQNGEIVRSTKPVSNQFAFSRLAPGKYDIVFTADGRATSVIAGVPVTSTTSSTALSTSAAPITLASSTTRTIGGAITLAPADASVPRYATVRQTVDAGISVIVKRQAVNLATGGYSIAGLPVAAPQVVTYSGNLPFVFAASTTTLPGAGKYVVEGSAPGYATKSLPAVDISTVSQTAANIVLTP
jgi:hypothetical protein